MNESEFTRSIILVEDSVEDYYAFLRIIKQLNNSESVSHFDNGDAALQYFEKLAQVKPQFLPAIIFLDLNLPGADGYEILAYIKASQVLCRIPVIVISTSSNRQDVRHCYEKGASGYVVKPLNFDRFKQSIQSILDYWFNIVELPY